MRQRGSIRWRGKTDAGGKPVKGRGSYFAYWFVKDADGKRVQRSKGGFATRAAAQSHLTTVLGQVQDGTYSEPSKMTFVDYLRGEWLLALHSLKPSTRKGYSDLVEAYVIPHLGGERLADLTPGTIVRLYDTLRTSGRRRPSSKEGAPRGLSESSIHHVHVALSAALGHAVETGLLRVSPVAQLAKKSRPKASGETKPEMTTWTAEEARRFLAVSADDRLGPLFDLALNSGLRRGELVGLRWADVDLDGGRVSVRRNRVTVGYEVEEGTPKGKRARVVDLDDATVTVLRRHRTNQLRERMAWGEAWTDTGLVFTREDGTALHPQTATHHLRRLAKKAGVPSIRLHDLRHTHATLGLAAGVPVKVMQERLGHASSVITMDLYTHVVPGMQADAAAKIGGLLR